MTEFRCEPLGHHHDRKRFRCDVPELDSWFQQRARQDQQRRVAVVYVFLPKSDPSRVAGFYTLSATAIALSDLPDAFAGKLPRYPMVPAILIGRLAHDIEFPGIGRPLLYDALARAWRCSADVAAAAVVVDAKNEAARQFYVRHGFEPIPSVHNRLYLPMRTVEETI